jgi:FkbM family methyltransferase
MINLDYLEIGCCDFNLLSRNKKKIGLSIEPVKYYYNKLNTRMKLNIAISNKNGYCKVFYLDEKIINDYHLPTWLKGCNSINEYHPTMKKILLKHNLPLELIDYDEIEMLTLNKLIKKYNIKSIDYLKIDTEGHDYYILNEFFKNPSIYPNTIYFECNNLSNKELVYDMIKKIPYTIKYESNHNIKMVLNSSISLSS